MQTLVEYDIINDSFLRYYVITSYIYDKLNMILWIIWVCIVVKSQIIIINIIYYYYYYYINIMFSVLLHDIVAIHMYACP